MTHTRIKMGFFVAIFLLCLGSILLNVFLYSQLRKYYTLLYAVELDPLGLSTFEGVGPPHKDESLQTAVFYGDSRAAQWSAPDIEGYEFLNRGIGNQTTTQVLNRFEAHIEPLQPDVVILQVGINDLKTIPLFPDGKQQIISNCKENIRDIVDRSLGMNSRVIISTIFPTGNVPLQRRLVWSEDIDQAIVEVNIYIQSLASDHVIVFDAAKLLSDLNGKMKQEHSFDELHLNQAGYDALNAEFTKVLERIKKESP